MNSFLSKDVHIILSALEQDSENDLKVEYVTSQFINWNAVQEHFGKFLNLPIHDQCQNWFRTAISEMTVIFKQAETNLRVSCEKERHIFLEYCSWTGRSYDINVCLDKFLNSKGHSVENIEIILLLSSILENSLGNVLLLKAKSVPFLLRDLLISPELELILGRVPITFIQILLGTPLGLNLRNLVWHGFPNIYEIDSSCSAIIFIVISSLGSVLKNQGHSSQIKPRKLIQDVECNFIEINTKIDILNDEEIIDKISPIIYSTKFVMVEFKCYWDYIFKYYEKKKWSDALILLMPQMETIFRYIFCEINNEAHRLLTAETKTFYTTLDEIFDENIIINGEQKLNKLYNLFEHSFLELIHDVFIYLLGPRLRDKLSHGEINTQNISNQSVKTILCIIWYALLKFDAREKTESSKCLEGISSYKALYHRNSIFRKGAHSLLIKIQLMEQIQMPDMYNHDWKILSNQDSNEVKTFNKLYEKLMIQCKDIRQLSFIDKKLKLIDYVYNLTTLVISRPKHEKEITNAMNKIIQNLMLGIANTITSLNIKYGLFIEHKLHSKRRETYYQLIQIAPSVYFIIINISMVLLIIFQTMQKGEEFHNVNVKRLLKGLLQHTENLAKYVNAKQNKWKECQITITEIIKAIKVVYS